MNFDRLEEYRQKTSPFSTLRNKIKEINRQMLKRLKLPVRISDYY